MTHEMNTQNTATSHGWVNGVCALCGKREADAEWAETCTKELATSPEHVNKTGDSLQVPPTDDERIRIEQSNDIAYTVIEVAQNKAPEEFVTLDFRYGIADALWNAGYRKIAKTQEPIEGAG